MKTVGKITRLIPVLFLFLNCHGNLELMNSEELNPLYGSWENYASYPTHEIYTFIPPNKIEVYQYITWPTSNDIVWYYGTYQIPLKNVIYRKTNIQKVNQIVVNEYLPIDTLIYFIDKGYLNLYFEGRQFNRINIGEDTLLGSDYYRVERTSDSTYYHELYRFGVDTLQYCSIIIESSQYPSEWGNVVNASYSKSETELIIISNKFTIRYGYKYYNNKLVLAKHPRTYTRIK
jgi:hypothetical protein